MNGKMNDSIENHKTERSFDIGKTVQSFTNRLLVANRAQSTIKSYTRVIKGLYRFHQCYLYQLGIDQIIDFLTYLKVEVDLN